MLNLKIGKYLLEEVLGQIKKEDEALLLKILSSDDKLKRYSSTEETYRYAQKELVIDSLSDLSETVTRYQRWLDRLPSFKPAYFLNAEINNVISLSQKIESKKSDLNHLSSFLEDQLKLWERENDPETIAEKLRLMFRELGYFHSQNEKLIGVLRNASEKDIIEDSDPLMLLSEGFLLSLSGLAAIFKKGNKRLLENDSMNLMFLEKSGPTFSEAAPVKRETRKKTEKETSKSKRKKSETRDSGLIEAQSSEEKLGERRIPDELYNQLRKETPSQEIREMVNEGIELPMEDPVLKGLTINKPLHADHIVSMDIITRIEGFENLTKDQQLEVLNNEENFVGLSESANCSKGNKTFEDWKMHKSKGIKVDEEFKEEMIKREKEVYAKLKKQIDDFNKLNTINN